MGLQAGADQTPAWTAPCPPEARVAAVAAIALREHPEGPAVCSPVSSRMP